jgi:hypothetical protein
MTVKELIISSYTWFWTMRRNKEEGCVVLPSLIRGFFPLLLFGEKNIEKTVKFFFAFLWHRTGTDTNFSRFIITRCYPGGKDDRNTSRKNILTA